MRLRTFVLALLLTSATSARLVAQGAVGESAAQKDARMAWWRDARFGMFIHWGLYAVPAGTWKGERVTGLGEWIQERAKIPGEDYAPLTRQFNPTQFDADEWVRIAKDAGMKYIIITSKHHDGFALFDSKVSTYDIVNATPYQRDAIRALASAARRAGLKFGVYYSIMDWHHPDAQAPAYPSYNSRTFKNPNFGRYVETYMKPQLRELVTQYPEIDVLWFDGEWISDWSDEQGRSLYDWLRGDAAEPDHQQSRRPLTPGHEWHERQQGRARRLRHAGAGGAPAGPSWSRLGDVHDPQRDLGLPDVR